MQGTRPTGANGTVAPLIMMTADPECSAIITALSGTETEDQTQSTNQGAAKLRALTAGTRRTGRTRDPLLIGAILISPEATVQHKDAHKEKRDAPASRSQNIDLSHDKRHDDGMGTERHRKDTHSVVSNEPLHTSAALEQQPRQKLDPAGAQEPPSEASQSEQQRAILGGPEQLDHAQPAASAGEVNKSLGNAAFADQAAVLHQSALPNKAACLSPTDEDSMYIDNTAADGTQSPVLPNASGGSTTEGNEVNGNPASLEQPAGVQPDVEASDSTTPHSNAAVSSQTSSRQAADQQQLHQHAHPAEASVESGTEAVPGSADAKAPHPALRKQSARDQEAMGKTEAPSADGKASQPVEPFQPSEEPGLPHESGGKSKSSTMRHPPGSGGLNGKRKLPDSAGREQHVIPHSLAGQKKPAKRSKAKLSFEDEVEDDADALQPFSLAASTARKFQTEREIVPLHPLHQSSAPTFRSSAPLTLHHHSIASGLASKTLGRLHFGVATTLGAKPTMEDRHVIIPSYSPGGTAGQVLQDGVPRSFVAVYDGHNGQRAAESASHRLHLLLARDPALRKSTGEGALASAFQEEAAMAAALKKAFQDMDEEILAESRRDGLRDGSTAVMVLRLGSALYAAHVGDSRAVLCQKGRALRLTEDHKPDHPAERQRIHAAGGKVEMQGVWRVISGGGPDRPRSGLAVSRGFGDIDHKEPKRLVSCEPDVNRRKLMPGDAFIIVASDGLWDALTDQHAVDIAARSLASSKQPSMQSSAAAPDAQAKAAADELVRAAVPTSGDNITVVVVTLVWSP
ncbi:hypothetical protein WJX74_000939 [Apatococcus lobatus]|uniref:PPM-type phosphatase domain-containing protein n=1 Tax=Apatococcus lobatus TaxID=904363 RepID=A0AAW1QMP2_9CHLO